MDIRKYAFSQRTVNEWNKLPGECENDTSVNKFKNKLDDHFKRTRQIKNKKYREPRTLDKPRAFLSWCHPNVHVIMYLRGMAVQLNPVKSTMLSAFVDL